ncbi:MAG TPA: carbohydrate ABC transporter permease [Thermomicrobiales bacterium]|nr:carbohydrate ABC transporter permease [Thermomicrobiales bacterium]
MATSSAVRPRAIASPAAVAPEIAAKAAARRATLERGVTHLLLIVAALICAAPFFYVIAASFKDAGSLFQYPPVWVQLPPYLGNYQRLLFESGFPRWLLNTLIVATCVTGIKLIFDSMAGYALAKLEFTGKRIVFLLMLILLMVPFAALLIPLWTIAHNLHITNTYLALILPPLANPLGVFLMRQFILGLPKDLENAARLEGVSEFGIYWRIILPLVKPGLVVLAVIIFTDQFMSFIWPLVATTSDDLQVLTVGVAGLRAKGGVNYGLWSAAAVMSLAPIAVFFFALQRQFLARSVAGAFKQ